MGMTKKRGEIKAPSSSSSLSPPPDTDAGRPKKKARTSEIPKPTDEFQQVTRPAFVDRYRVEGLGRGGDVFYQPDVCLIRATGGSIG